MFDWDLIKVWSLWLGFLGLTGFLTVYFWLGGQKFYSFVLFVIFLIGLSQGFFGKRMNRWASDEMMKHL